MEVTYGKIYTRDAASHCRTGFNADRKESLTYYLYCLRNYYLGDCFWCTALASCTEMARVLVGSHYISNDTYY